MDDADHYDLLGVSSDATEADIRAAFIRQIKQWHPDTNPVDGDRARCLIEAKATLTDPDRRNAYDAELRRGHLVRRQRANAPRWIFVCSHGLGEFLTIHEAVDSASDGDKIYVLPGVYHESLLRIEKAVEVVGQPTDQEEILIETEDDGIYLSGVGAVLRSVSVQSVNPHSFGCIAASHSAAVVSHCRFTSRQGTGLIVAEGSLLVEGCTFEACRHAIRLERVNVAVLGNKFVANMSCVLARPGADCVIENNDFQRTEGAIIEAQGTATLNVSRNCFGAAAVGIAVSENTRGVVDRNRFIGLTEQTGILLVDGKSEVVITDNAYE
jgi:hypothetical protein